MTPAFWTLGLGLCLFVHPGTVPTGYVLPRDQTVGAVVASGSAYVPREGDLIFFDDDSPVWQTLFAIAGTGPPLHMGIVVKLPGNRWSVLEAGPDDGIWVELRDLVPRLHKFTTEKHGTVTIRRCREPLSDARSAALTVFAQRQAGKRYAIAWLLLQGTPFRVRGLLEPWLARTRLDPPSWICSEISIAAGTIAGLFDPKVVASNVAYPRDLVDNHRYDLRASWHDPEQWSPTALVAGR